MDVPRSSESDRAMAAAATPSERRTDEQLSHLLPALWKTLTRATRGFEQMPTVESQVTILRKIVDVGPLPPAHLAEELHLARPTISNLLRDLEADGLVVREPSQTDGRSVIVTATAHGNAVLQQFRVGRLEVLGEALEALNQQDRDLLDQVLPTLERLLDQLERIAQAVPVQERAPA